MALDKELLKLRLINDTGCSEKQAEKLIEKYIEITREQLAQNYGMDDHPFHYLSLENFKDPLRIMIKGQVIYARDLLQSYNERLFDVITIGNNLNQRLTKVKLNYSYEEIVLAAGSAEEYTELVYRPFEGTSDKDIDYVPLDMDSLAHYQQSAVSALETARAQNKPEEYIQTLERNLTEAQKISLIGLAFNGVMPHIKHESVFGRLYYRGPNLQTCPKLVRNAALGDCFEYDIENSALAWKLSMFKSIEEGCAPATLELLDHKLAVRRRLANHVFNTDAEWAIKIIKEALTALGFGARPSSTGYVSQGRYQAPALNTIIKSQQKCDRFLNDSWVKEFVEEQKTMRDSIINNGRAQGQDNHWKTIPDLCDKAGRIMPNSVLAYLYQHDEREIIEFIKREFEPYEVLLLIHDCVYTRKRVGTETMVAVKQALQDFGAFFKISRVEHTAYKFDDDLDGHQQRMLEEQRRAEEYGRQKFGNNFTPIQKSHRMTPLQTAPTDYECYDGQAHYGDRYDADHDPYIEDMADDEVTEYQKARQHIMRDYEQPEWVNTLLSNRP